MHATLVTLKDVYGITGSFVYARSGHLVARELPPMFDDAALSEAGSRLTRLQETFAAVGDKLEVAVLRYREHKVYVKMLPGGRALHHLERRRQHAGAEDGGQPGRPSHRADARSGRRRSALAEARLDAGAVDGAGADARPPALAPPGMRRFRGRPVGVT